MQSCLHMAPYRMGPHFTWLDECKRCRQGKNMALMWHHYRYVGATKYSRSQSFYDGTTTAYMAKFAISPSCNGVCITTHDKALHGSWPCTMYLHFHHKRNGGFACRHAGRQLSYYLPTYSSWYLESLLFKFSSSSSSLLGGGSNTLVFSKYSNYYKLTTLTYYSSYKTLTAILHSNSFSNIIAPHKQHFFVVTKTCYTEPQASTLK